MRPYILLALLALPIVTLAQSPVNWKFTAHKTAAQTYQIRLDASVSGNWHIYSQFTPNGGPRPTVISFTKNPLITLTGNAVESGKLVTKHEDAFDVDVKYFEGGASFVQTLTVRSKVKTNISGTGEFMVCNDQQCLPSRTIPFTLTLE